MLFAMPLLCKATSRAAREGEERFRRRKIQAKPDIIGFGEGGAAEGGGNPRRGCPVFLPNFGNGAEVLR